MSFQISYTGNRCSGPQPERYEGYNLKSAIYDYYQDAIATIRVDTYRLSLEGDSFAALVRWCLPLAEDMVNAAEGIALPHKDTLVGLPHGSNVYRLNFSHQGRVVPLIYFAAAGEEVWVYTRTWNSYEGHRVVVGSDDREAPSPTTRRAVVTAIHGFLSHYLDDISEALPFLREDTMYLEWRSRLAALRGFVVRAERAAGPPFTADYIPASLDCAALLVGRRVKRLDRLSIGAPEVPIECECGPLLLECRDGLCLLVLEDLQQTNLLVHQLDDEDLDSLADKYPYRTAVFSRKDRRDQGCAALFREPVQSVERVFVQQSSGEYLHGEFCGLRITPRDGPPLALGLSLAGEYGRVIEVFCGLALKENRRWNPALGFDRLSARGADPSMA